MQRHHPALLPIAGEAFGGEPFTGSYPLQVFVVDTQLSLPIAFENRGVKPCHSSRVGIALRRDIDPSRTSLPNHFQNVRRIVESHAGYVNNLQWRPGQSRRRENFLEG